MQPGRVGLSAQLISLMRHRECVMKAKRVFLIAIGVLAIVAGVSSGQFAEADAVENEAVSIMGSVFDDLRRILRARILYERTAGC